VFRRPIAVIELIDELIDQELVDLVIELVV